jgi:hypothetical protein
MCTNTMADVTFTIWPNPVDSYNAVSGTPNMEVHLFTTKPNYSTIARCQHGITDEVDGI